MPSFKFIITPDLKWYENNVWGDHGQLKDNEANIFMKSHLTSFTVHCTVNIYRMVKGLL